MQTASTNAPPAVYGPTDAAKALGISVGYLHRLIDAGTARPTVPSGLNGRRVFSEADLRDLARKLGRTLPAPRS